MIGSSSVINLRVGMVSFYIFCTYSENGCHVSGDVMSKFLKFAEFLPSTFYRRLMMKVVMVALQRTTQ